MEMRDKVNIKIDSAKRILLMVVQLRFQQLAYRPTPNFSRDCLKFRNRENRFQKFVETSFLKNLKVFTHQLRNKIKKQE